MSVAVRVNRPQRPLLHDGPLLVGQATGRRTAPAFSDLSRLWRRDATGRDHQRQRRGAVAETACRAFGPVSRHRLSVADRKDSLLKGSNINSRNTESPSSLMLRAEAENQKNQPATAAPPGSLNKELELRLTATALQKHDQEPTQLRFAPSLAKTRSQILICYKELERRWTPIFGQ